MRRWKAVLALTAAVAASFLVLAGAAGAQTTSCGSFTSRAAAQTFYDAHKNDDPNNPDPNHMDADGNGIACENYPYPSAAPAASAPLPNNGAETGVMALSGLSLLEAGYGMTLLARRYGVKRRNVPVYLLRKLVSAGRSGQGAVALGDDIYLVHESMLTATADDYYRYVDMPTEEHFELVDEDDIDEDDVSLFARPPAPTPRINLYAALAKGAQVVDEPPPVVVEEELEPDPWDDEFAWRV